MPFIVTILGIVLMLAVAFGVGALMNGTNGIDGVAFGVITFLVGLLGGYVGAYYTGGNGTYVGGYVGLILGCMVARKFGLRR
ncbi:hypothetical protein GCM10023195_20790 [Actinoallomurus liliacearum]|uniref:GlsB/YeaQ/YmgE family stress response membrane protein n=1 Tax=Actinoallomurus liliacearum TaxID=1080073 RepID=A0ABP8TE39_9ACTN